MRVISQQAGDHVKLHGKENDFLERVMNASYFAPIHGKLEQLLDPAGFIGRAPQQVRGIQPVCGANRSYPPPLLINVQVEQFLAEANEAIESYSAHFKKTARLEL